MPKDTRMMRNCGHVNAYLTAAHKEVLAAPPSPASPSSSASAPVEDADLPPEPAVFAEERDAGVARAAAADGAGGVGGREAVTPKAIAIMRGSDGTPNTKSTSPTSVAVSTRIGASRLPPITPSTLLTEHWT